MALLEEQARTGKAPSFSHNPKPLDDGEDFYDGGDFDIEEPEAEPSQSAPSGSVDAPADYVWGYQFRRHMGWTDDEVWDNQPDDWVWKAWRIWQLEVRYGITDKVSLW